MKTKDLIKYFFSCGALIYTVGSVLILTVSLAASESASASILAPKPFLFFLGFAYLISLGNTLFKINTIPPVIRRLLHCLCYVVGFLAFILLCGVKFAYSAIFAAVLALIYAISVITASVIRKQISKTNRDNASETAKPEKKQTKKEKTAKTAENTYHNRFS